MAEHVVYGGLYVIALLLSVLVITNFLTVLLMWIGLAFIFIFLAEKVFD